MDNKAGSYEMKHATPSSSCHATWWERRSRLERRLVLLLTVALVVLVALVIVVAVVISNSKTDKEDEVCLTSDCVRTASRILEGIDSKVDPCMDFFQFACGSWNRKNVIPDDRPSYDTFDKLRDELEVILKTLLEVPTASAEPTAIKQAKNLYQSCLNMTQIEARGDEPLHHIIQSLGGWPVLNSSWSEAPFNIVDLVAQLRLYNTRVLINCGVSSDDKNSNVNIIQLDQAKLGLPSRDYYLEGIDAKPLAAYERFAIEVAVMLGADPESAKKDIREMILFEMEMANITTPEDQRRNPYLMYHRYTIAELYTNITSNIDWLRLLNGLFSNVSISINETEEVVVFAPEYLSRLAQLLDATPKRIIANYMLWRIIMSRVNDMPQHYLDLRRELIKVLYGTNSDQARWRTCVRYVNDRFGMAVGRMFVQERFDESAKAVAMEMIQNIRDAFNKLLEDVPWMDQQTRKVARVKADYISEQIGYPEYIMNDTALNLDYEGIVMVSQHYFENVLVNLHTVARNTMKNLRKPVDKIRWPKGPVIVNAFYSAPRNQMIFPAGILQPPFYHKNYPKSMNYGGLAMVIGHEITHGFDDKGRMFDKDGNLVQWWSDGVVQRFKEQAQCIIDQYSNYTIPEVGLNLNGKQMQGENIADNGGLKQSFWAYRKWVKQRGREEPPLPGIPFSHNQLIFLSFAQIWCGSSRPEKYIDVIRSGKHSPDRFRVIGTLSNSYDFAEAFSCPAGSPMNPINKCAVW